MDLQNNSGNDIRDIFPILKRRKWLIIIPFVLVMITVGVGSQFVTPEFESSTIVSIQSKVQFNQELKGLLGIPGGRRNPRDRIGEVRAIHNRVTSSYYLSQLVDELRLLDDPALSIRAQNLQKSNPELTDKGAMISLLQVDFQNKVFVTLVADDQIKIVTQSTNRVMARDIANTLAKIFISESRKAELRSVRSSQDFSDVQLSKYEADLQTKIDEKTSLEKQLLGIDLGNANATDDKRSQFSTEIDRHNLDLKDLYTKEANLLVALRNETDLNSNPQGPKLNSSSAIRSARAELSRHQETMDNLMNRFEASSSELINFRIKQGLLIDEMEALITSQVVERFSDKPADLRGKIVTLFATRIHLDYFQELTTTLQMALDKLDEKVDLFPEIQANIDRLNREIASLTLLSGKFKGQLETSSLSQALLQDASASKYSVIEPAKTPLVPFKPDRIQLIIYGVILGIVISGAATVVAELVDHSLRKVEETEEFLGMPVIGIIPPIRTIKLP